LLAVLGVLFSTLAIWAWAHSGRELMSAVIALGAAAGTSVLLVIVASDRMCEGIARGFDVILQVVSFGLWR